MSTICFTPSPVIDTELNVTVFHPDYTAESPLYEGPLNEAARTLSEGVYEAKTSDAVGDFEGGFVIIDSGVATFTQHPGEGESLSVFRFVSAPTFRLDTPAGRLEFLFIEHNKIHVRNVNQSVTVNGVETAVSAGVDMDGTSIKDITVCTTRSDNKMPVSEAGKRHLIDLIARAVSTIRQHPDFAEAARQGGVYDTTRQTMQAYNQVKSSGLSAHVFKIAASAA